jgi:hypothetical protein
MTRWFYLTSFGGLFNSSTRGASVQAGKWASVAFRIFGIVNLIFVAIGLWAISYPIAAVATDRIGNSPDNPYFLRAFWTMTSVNLVFLAVLGFTGVRLLQLRRIAVKVCNILFVAAIVYFLCIPWGIFPRDIDLSIAAATGVGNMGISVNLFTGYPIFALIGLNLANRRFQSPTAAETVAF